jgi:hypothetical protein
MEWDIAGYWSNPGEKSRSAGARVLREFACFCSEARTGWRPSPWMYKSSIFGIPVLDIPARDRVRLEIVFFKPELNPCKADMGIISGVTMQSILRIWEFKESPVPWRWQM